MAIEIRTRLTELLKIKYPIIQSAMGIVSTPSLVAAVSEAGGLGILSGGAMYDDPEELRAAIREVRRLTDKPFGVNVTATAPGLERKGQVMVEEGVAVASYGKGDPRLMLEKCKPAGIVCMPTIGAVAHLERAEADGADAVIIQGTEAGGHCSFVGTMVLLPLVTGKAKVPVAAAGGFCDGRGLVAALALGAEAMAMGTRFIATRESPVAQNIKELLLRTPAEDTIITPLVTGMRCRALKSKLVDLLEQRGEDAMGAPRELKAHSHWGAQKQHLGWIEGDAERGFLPCGQVVGRIQDIPTCKELIERIMAEAEVAWGEVNARIKKTRR